MVNTQDIQAPTRLEHHRVILPIGQGGLDVEKIGDTVAVFDCGSTSLKSVKTYIDMLYDLIDSHTINYLFISHFDNDHVNALTYLLQKMQVKEIFVPKVNGNYERFYNFLTDYAYNSIMDLIRPLVRNDELILHEVDYNDNNDIYYKDHIWEWKCRSLLRDEDLKIWERGFTDHNIDIASLDDAKYVDAHKTEINACIRDIFDSKGPNTKGLVMCSRACSEVPVKQVLVSQDNNEHTNLHNTETKCFYVGDADLMYAATVKDIYNWFELPQDELLLMQIPHHGSRYNSDASLERLFPAKYYFYHDKDDERIRKNNLYPILTSKNKLLHVHTGCEDIICNLTVLFSLV